MIDRLVAPGGAPAADERIGGIVPERNGAASFGPTEVVGDRLADEQGERHPSTARLILQLAVRRFREPQIGRDVLGHGGMTISRYRNIVNTAAMEDPERWR